MEDKVECAVPLLVPENGFLTQPQTDRHSHTATQCPTLTLSAPDLCRMTSELSSRPNLPNRRATGSTLGPPARCNVSSSTLSRYTRTSPPLRATVNGGGGGEGGGGGKAA
jgi:hypothetical protein